MWLLAALLVDGETVLVHVHLFETTSQLAENAVGGMWHPDELRRFFEKIRKYRGLLLRKPELFFSRVQIPRTDELSAWLWTPSDETTLSHALSMALSL